MIKKKAIPSLLGFLILTLLSMEEGVKPVGANPTTLQTFRSERKDVEIPYPQGWFVKEYKINNPYSLFLSREKVEKPEDKFKAGISLYKFYHQSWYLNLDPQDPEKSLQKMFEVYNQPLSGKQAEVKGPTPFAIKGAKAYLEEASRQSPDIRIRMYVLYAMKGDTLVSMTLEAPETEFQTYRVLYDEILKKAKFFFPGGQVSDNALLDAETEAGIRQAMGKGKMRDLVKLFRDLKQVQSLNPRYAKTKFLLGATLLHSSVGASPQDKNLLLSKAEQELKEAIALYETHGKDYQEPERKLNTSQCFFLLGDLYYSTGKKEAAKQFYKKSLEYYDHPGAKAALAKNF